MQTTSCTWPYVVPIGEDPAAHGHWCAFTDLYHTIPYHTIQYVIRYEIEYNEKGLRKTSGEEFMDFRYLAIFLRQRYHDHSEARWAEINGLRSMG